jgi:TRAP-type C4-dicarboxylate transport system substrate-binding protein
MKNAGGDHAMPLSLTTWHRASAAMAALVWALVGPAQAAPLTAVDSELSGRAPYRLRIVGGLAGLNQYTRQEEPFWNKDLARLSAGRYSAEIVPFDRAGVPGSEMLRLLQLGVVPFGTALMSSFTAQHPEYTAPDLAGLNPDIATLKLTLKSFRPYLEKALRDQHGVEALAIYVYPAQVVYCKQPMRSIADLAGRRTRVSSATQADFIGALGGVPVLTGFAQLVPSLTAGNTECAVTGTMSGNTLGLHTLTSHMHAMPVTWGLAVFGANQTAWASLPPELRALLRRELPRLESAIWEESERETADGTACNRGAKSCLGGRKGSMVVLPVSSEDERTRQKVLAGTVLPHWVQRCGKRCADIWNQTIGPVRGVTATATVSTK